MELQFGALTEAARRQRRLVVAAAGSAASGAFALAFAAFGQLIDARRRRQLLGD
jgi:hypothetical protein